MKQILSFEFEFKLFLGLVAGFIVATIIGTVSHECGHYLAAKWLGYDAEINYAFTFWKEQRRQPGVDELYIATAGPIMTMLTGTTGLLLLFVSRKKVYQKELSFLQWSYLFLALFWLRQVTIFFMNLFKTSPSGDEFKMADYLNIPAWSISVSTALIGLLIAICIVFKFIPLQQRLTFILAGISGGILGYALWFKAFGPFVMP